MTELVQFYPKLMDTDSNILLQWDLIAAQNLIKVAASRKFFTLQCLHITNSIVHMLISSTDAKKTWRAELSFEGYVFSPSLRRCVDAFKKHPESPRVSV